MGYPVAGASVGCGPIAGAKSCFTNTGTILVLFILLVIILRTFCF
ncbi:YjcZ family sporulation protein [Paenibacillus algorifonticola]